ncbi:MAG: hypothetical protein WCR16_02500 [Bacilli bacterium]|jgi:hypothetical protein
MNLIELRTFLDSLPSAEALIFYVGGEIVSSRFDKIDHKVEENDNLDESVSYALYSLVTQLVIGKAKGREESKKIEDRFAIYFQKITSSLPDRIRENAEAEKEKALPLIHNFLFDVEKIELPELLSGIAPLVLLGMAEDENGLNKDVFKKFERNEEKAMNMAVLAIRSVFHSFLTLPDTDPNSISADPDNLTNGLFVYKDSLFVPTYSNAFTLSAFKEVGNKALDRISRNLSLSEVKNIVVLYLSRDFLVKAVLEK